MFKCQITFQKYCYQCQISKFLQGRNWVLLFLWYNVVLRTVYNGTILRLKLDVPWGHIEEKKNFTPPWYPKFFNGFSRIIGSKMKKLYGMYYWRNSSNNKCKINEITIACFINSLCKFTKTLQKNLKFFSLRWAIFLATLSFFCEGIFVSKFGPCNHYTRVIETAKLA